MGKSIWSAEYTNLYKVTGAAEVGRITVTVGWSIYRQSLGLKGIYSYGTSTHKGDVKLDPYKTYSPFPLFVLFRSEAVFLSTQFDVS